MLAPSTPLAASPHAGSTSQERLERVWRRPRPTCLLGGAGNGIILVVDDDAGLANPQTATIASANGRQRAGAQRWHAGRPRVPAAPIIPWQGIGRGATAGFHAARKEGGLTKTDAKGQGVQVRQQGGSPPPQETHSCPGGTRLYGPESLRGWRPHAATRSRVLYSESEAEGGGAGSGGRAAAIKDPDAPPPALLGERCCPSASHLPPGSCTRIERQGGRTAGTGKYISHLARCTALEEDPVCAHGQTRVQAGSRSRLRQTSGADLRKPARV